MTISIILPNNCPKMNLNCLEKEFWEWFWRQTWQNMFQTWLSLKTWLVKTKFKMEKMKNCIKWKIKTKCLVVSSLSWSVQCMYVMWVKRPETFQLWKSGLIFCSTNSSCKVIWKQNKACQLVCCAIVIIQVFPKVNLDLLDLLLCPCLLS